MKTGLSEIKSRLLAGAQSALTRNEIIALELEKWKVSSRRRDMIAGERYDRGEHDILRRERTVIGEGGRLQRIENLPNNKIVDNQYAKMVVQKVNHLLGRPLTFDTENRAYEQALKSVFNKRFQRTLKNLGESCINGGIAWLHPYYDEGGELGFKKFEPYEILPFWRDSAHTELDFAVRLYEVAVYEGSTEKTVEKVEIYTADGIERYTYSNRALVPDVEPIVPYVTISDEDGILAYNWARIPLIAFKANNKEIPLLNRIKSLQDGINIMLSDFENNLQEDARNTILVLKNYEGESLAEFRHNLATYGAVKVRTTPDGHPGGIETLTVEVNSENYKVILQLFKKALVENAMGYDAKDDRIVGSPNQMSIQSMYSDIELDANGMETEFQAAFEELLWFVNVHLHNSGLGSFNEGEVDIIFNRDMLMNESEIIENVQKSMGILSADSIIAQHPWVSDVQKEKNRLEKEAAANGDPYRDAFEQAKVAANAQP